MGGTNAAVAPGNSVALEFLTKPVDFDLLRARLAQLPRAAE